MTIHEQISSLSEAELDALPLGIIRLDRNAKILYYNRSQAELSRRARKEVIGLNFFRDLAPCTAVRAFQGRFEELVCAPESGIEPFDFILRFAWGDRAVKVTMVRRAGLDDEFYIVVAVLAVLP